ncbi:amino acid adenylation domain-containing protein [Pantoea sp. B9002]|uniref:non-ribosomal peptide synthetase n=1 Tax=Pantoea sp. B9002 TaxID=2726979 RepID=UPI0015A22D3B|nr:amino acid adenylation domain-containing protein [Pantoea sp. B9002]
MHSIPLSPYSLIFWHDYQLNPASSEYNISFTQHIQGDFNVNHFLKSMRRFLNDHPLFNSYINIDKDEPVWQEINPDIKITTYNDSEELSNLIKSPFTLTSGPLYRILLQKTDDKNHILTLVFHHIILDGNQFKNIINRISEYYNNPNSICNGNWQTIAEKYGELRHHAEKLDNEKTQFFWQNLASNENESFILPFVNEQQNHHAEPGTISEVRFTLSKQNWSEISRFTYRPFTLFSQVWATLLARCAGQNDVTLFYPLAIRKAADIQLGAQINTSLMLVKLQDTCTLNHLCQQAEGIIRHKEQPVDCFVNELPTHKILQYSGCRDLQLAFAQTDLRTTPFTFNQCSVTPLHDYYCDLGGINLSLEYEETSDGWLFRLRYRNGIFIDQQVSRCAEYFKHLLANALAAPDVPLLTLPLLTKQDIAQLLPPTATIPNRNTSSLVTQFKHIARQYPGGIALSYRGSYLTYCQLDQLSCRLAEDLSAALLNPVKPQPIAIYCDKGPEFIIAIIAILKAGHIYMPIAVEAANERTCYQLEHSASPLMLVTSAFDKQAAALVAMMKAPPATITIDLPSLQNKHVSEPLASPTHSEAAIIFTSGTTGNPKGVLIEQSAIIELVTDTNYLQLTHQDSSLFLASPIFDVATLEIWGALLNGGKLVIPQSTQTLSSDVTAFRQLIHDEGITFICVTRTLFDTLYLLDKNLFNPLKYLMVGGEGLTVAIMRELSSRPQRPEKILNGYGPTECTTMSSWYEIPRNFAMNTVPIGKATTGRELYILNNHLQVQPEGASGELYIGGRGLARGYINNPEQTASSFITNPFRPGRLYKTGDQVKQMPDGNLLFCGRKDGQIKIRGHRVELSEIENALNNCSAIQQSAVIALPKSEGGQLAAWFVVKAGEIITPQQLKQELSAKLPGYMVPRFFTPIQAIPLTLSGKLDYRALGKPAREICVEEETTASPVASHVLHLARTLLHDTTILLQDHFYRAGGDSIQAIQLIAGLREAGYNANLSDLDHHATLAEFAQHLTRREMTKHAKAPQPEGHYYPVTPLQAGLLTWSLMHPDDDAYFIQQVMDYGCELDLPHYFAAWDLVRKRYPALRTQFDWQHGTFRQQVLPWQPQGNQGMQLIDISQYSADEQQQQLKWFLQQQRSQPIDLKRPGTLSLTLLKLADDHYQLIKSEHHALSDGWSCNNIWQQLHSYYDRLMAGEQPEVEPETAWLTSLCWLQEHNAQSHAFWQQQALTFNTPNNIGWLLDKPHQHSDFLQVKQAQAFEITLDSDAVQTLKQSCQKAGTTLNVLLQFAWHKLMQIYTNDTQTLVGTVLSGRNLPIDGITESAGMFINTLPLAVNWQEGESVRQQLQQIHQTIVAMNQHHAYALSDLQSGQQRLFQSMVVFENYPESRSTDGISMHAQSLAIEGKPDYPLMLLAFLRNEQLTLSLDYDAALMSETRAAQLVNHVASLMAMASAHPEQPHDALSLGVTLGPMEEPSPTQSQGLISRFEEMVSRYPAHPAIIWQQQSITYQQLNTAANALAQQLFRRISTEEPVIILMEKQPQWLVAMLAILKAGGSYLPIAIDTPPARVHLIAQDAGVRQVITSQSHAHHVSTLFATEADINITCLAESLTGNTQIMSPPQRETALAGAILYTSGTSGKPKGVIIEQAALVALVVEADYIRINPDDRFIFLANPAFDAASFEIWGALLNGASLVIPEDSMALISDANRLKTLMQQQPVSIMWLTRSLFDALYLADNQLFNQLRYLLVGGEALTPAIMKQLAAQPLRPEHILNGYGPTECTTFTTVYAVPSDEQHATIPLGKAINGRHLWIMDSHGQPVPEGAPGELYVGGLGVARCYLNQPEQSELRFIVHPQLKCRLYRTGDRVRQLADGNLDYLGRIDNQVKIRGFRIEPDEVAMALLNLPGIQQSAVTVWQAGTQKQLAAWLVLAKDSVLDIASLRQLLEERLPEYMIPASFNLLNHLPLTANGKLDEKALPTPATSLNHQYCAPRDAFEQGLCAAWQKVLNLDEVGIHDNFFRIGGDSIQSILLVTELRKAGYSLDAGEINRSPTVAKMAQTLQRQVEQITQEQQAISGACPLLPVQQWFFDQNFVQPHHWNQAFMVRLPDGLSATQLQSALQQLAQQHDMLRTHYRNAPDAIEQWIEAGEKFTSPMLTEIDAASYSATQLEEQLTALQAGLNYEQGPLWRAALIRRHPGGHDRLWFAFHHLIIDAVSWRILSQDLQQLIEQGPLAYKSTSYRRWALAQQEYLQQHPDDVLWWQRVMATSDADSAFKSVAAAQSLTINFSAKQTQQLLRDAGQAWNTNINDLLLAALAQALSQISGRMQHCITLEGHGREPWDEQIDLSQTVGWFTTLFPVNLQVQTDTAATIVATKEMLRQIPAKGMGYGIAHQQGLLGEFALPSIAFNYLGVLSSSQETWSLVTEHCGKTVNGANVSAYALTLDGAVSGGQLRFFINSQLPEQQTQQFAAAFEQALGEVIALCCEKAQQLPQLTASDYGPVALSEARLTQLQQLHPTLSAILPATPLQQGMIYHTLAHPQDDAYRVQQLMHYDCALNITHYQQAWQLAVKHFPIMRTAFHWEDGAMLQLVIADAAIPAENLPVIDLSALPSHEQQAQLSQLQQRDRQQSFSLHQPAAIRLALIKHHEQRWSVLKSQHHAICDGWSEPCVLNAVHEYYEMLQRGEQPQVEEQTSWLEAQRYLYRNKQKYVRYWQQEKARLSTTNDLRCLAPERALNATSDNFSAASRGLTFNKAEVEQMRACITQLGITLNTLVQFAWHKLIQIFSQDEYTQVGTVVAGRDLPVVNINQSVGPYINTLPLAIEWPQDACCAEVLLAIQQKIAELNSHSNISLVELQTDGQALFNSLVVFENYPAAAHSSVIANAWHMDAAYEKLDYPLALLAWESHETLTLQLKFFTDWLSDSQADERLQQLRLIIQQCVQNPDRLHETIELPCNMAQPAAQPLTGSAPTLLMRFQTLVQQYPDRIALSCHTSKLSYAELENRSNQLARHILTRYDALNGGTLPPETPIALLMDKGHDLIISMLAILKAGGCYVPISTEYPAERIAFILAETDTPMLLTHQQHQHHVAGIDLPCLLLDEDFSTLSAAAIAINHERNSTGAIIFTSGTTGVPKGVPITQQAMVDLVVDNPYIAVGAEDALMLLSSPVFDAATFEIWGALLNGAKLVIPPSTQELASDTAQFKTLMLTEGVSVMWVTRSLFDLLYLRQRDLFNSLRYLLVGGEALSADIMRQLAAQPERPRHILNGYGPTECTTFTTVYEITTSETGTSIPIGKAIAGRQLYVLNRLMKPVPVGAPGELYVGGSAVSRGYLNRPDLTARHFVANPFGEGTLYKTGDWVRYRADGELEYLGRKDQQVKIRGFRVELEEIVSALKQQPGVEHAVVLLRELDGQKKICAWCVLLPGHAFSPDDLMSALERTLPDYMLPAAITVMDSLPVTVNGKLDSARLPAPVLQLSDNYRAPRTELESTIAAVWQQVLSSEPVSINANFFRVGGDSIQSILVTTELRKRGIHCSTRDIFAAKTIEQLAQLIELRPQPQAVISEQGCLSGEFALLPVQHWFNSLKMTNPHWFNQAFTLALPADLRAEDLRHYLQKLVAHHDMLRARFTFDGEQIINQRYLAQEEALSFATFDRAMLTHPQQLEEKCSEWQRYFTLNHDALYRFIYLYDSRGTQPPALFCAFHHLIIDAVSWRIVASDLQTLYEGNALESKATSYRQWVQCTSDYAAQNLAQVNYWQQQIAGQPDYWQQATRQTARQQITQRLSATLTGRLLHNVHHVYHTEVGDFLLTALSHALQSWHGQAASYLTLEGHGRESIAEQADVSRTLGWFTTLFPLCLRTHADEVQSLRSIKDQLRAIPTKGFGYGALKFAAADTPPMLEKHELPAISFNYLGQISGAQQQPWMILPYGRGEQSAPENTSHNLLDFVVSIEGDELLINVNSGLPAAINAQIVARFAETLETLVAHCHRHQQAGNSWFSPSDFPDCDISMETLDSLQQRTELENLYPSTDTQRELIYFNRINPDFQIDQNIIRIDGDFNPQVMAEAWQYAARRYDVLRTGYIESRNGRRPLAFVCKQIAFPVIVEDWSTRDAEQLPAALQLRMLAERNRPMAIDQPGLMNVIVVRVSASEHYMIQTFNHVLFDGWSLNNILSSLLEDYQRRLRGEAVHFTPLSFAAFPQWLQKFDVAAADRFWSGYLSDAPMNQRLACDDVPSIDLTREKRMRKFAHSLSPDQTAALHHYAAHTGFTPNQITQLAWMQALAQMLECDDVVIGTTMSERPADINNIAQLVGLFVASPVLRLQAIRQQSASTLLAQIADSQPDRQQYAFHELNHYDSDWQPTSPFGSLFVFESMPSAQIGELPFTLTPLDNVSGSNHQTVLCLIPEADQLHLSLFYDAGELSEQTISRLCNTFIQAITHIVQ